MNQVLTALFMAVSAVESGGDANKVGGDPNNGRGAYGIVQITQPCLDDLNVKHGTDLKLTDFKGNVSLSRWAFFAYGRMYGAKTPEDYARLWRRGPHGRDDAVATEYWTRVRNLMDGRTK